METEEAWYTTIDRTVDGFATQVYQFPDSLIGLLAALPIDKEDSLSHYYRKVQYARCHFLANRTEEALAYINEVEAYGKRTKASPSLHTLLALNDNARAVILQSRNEREEALRYLQNAYSHAAQADSRREQPNICINAADICRQLGKLPEAAHWYRTAMQVADSLGLNGMQHSIQTGLGLVYADLHHFELAQQYYERAEKEYPPQDDQERFYFYNSRGNAYYYAKQYPEALACFRQAYTISQKYKSPFNNAIVETNLGEIFLLMQQNDSAHHYLDLANTFFNNSPQADDAIQFYLNGLYAALALQEEDLKAAQHYLSKPYDLKRLSPTYLYLYNRRLMDYHARRGNYREAYERLQEMNVYNDSLRNAQHLNRIAETEYRYRQDTALLHRDIAIARAGSEVSQLRSTVNLIVALLILTLGGGVWFYLFLRQRHEKRRRQQLELITRLRMENVRNRFSPHFVFNALNAVMGNLTTEESRILPLRRLVEVLRSNLQTADRLAISLHEEMEQTKSYAELRHSINPNLPLPEWLVDDEVDKELLIPATLLQIPVENALKHAFPHIGSDPTERKQDMVPFIRIHIRREGEATLLTIDDNGTGFQSAPTRRNDSTGTGLRMLFRTVELLNQKNLRKMKLELEDRATLSQGKEKGTRVSIAIPTDYTYDI